MDLLEVFRKIRNRLTGEMQELRFAVFTRIIVVAAAYFIGGLLGKQSSFMGGKVALVWPHSGVALAAILLFGYRYWPGVALGSVLFCFQRAKEEVADKQLDSDALLVVLLGTVLGSTISALLCGYLLERFFRFRNSLERVRDVAGFVGLACVLGTTVNAAFYVVSLYRVGLVPFDELFPRILDWWVPNAMGAMVVAPFILTWGTRSTEEWELRHMVEAFICAVGLTAGTLVSFHSSYIYGVENYPLAFLPYPFLVWGALRFGLRGAATGTLLIASLAIYSLLHGQGPFVATTQKESLTLIGCYIGILAVTNMLLAAATTERRWAEIALRKSEQMFNLISENVNDLIAVTDATGKRLYNSPFYKDLLGDPRWLRGSDAFEQIHPEDRQRVKEVFQETIRTGVSQRLEYRFLLSDGSVRYIESHGNFVKGGLGEPSKVVSIARDITDRKRGEEALQKSEQLWRTMFAAANDAILLLDDKFQILACNQMAEKIYGYGPELVGMNLRELRSPQTRLALDDQMTDARQKNGAIWEAVHRRQDESVFPVEVSTKPLIAAGQQQFVQIVRDITERKQIEADLAKARDEALVSARLKSEFLANMSHEIRTPINGVIGLTRLLLRTPLSPQQRDYADSINLSADALLTIINDILDFSKIEAGKLTFETIDFDLRDAVEGTVEILAERAHAKGVELAGFIPSSIPTQLRGDVGRLRQILTNLLSNSVKFTQYGEVITRISKQSENASHVVIRFEVQDTGIGIPPEAQGRLFQAFSQADGSTTRKYGGTGLGLAICKQLVTMMHGEIGLKSVPGKGSTFWFVIPFEKQDLPAAPATSTELTLRHVRVLIVDDNATNRQILHHQVLSWGMRDNCAASGAEALQILRNAAATDAYAVAILDMQMPGMDGLALAREIKADSSIAGTRLILLASIGQQCEAPGLRAGVAACLTKPVKQSRLFDCLMETVGRDPGSTPAAVRPAVTGTAPPSTPARVAAQTVRILLAEDNLINQKVALGQLQELGYGADVAGNGVEVLAALERIHYDIILMDCHMPEMDGYETTRRIRQVEQESAHSHTGKAQLHIIAMTANAMQGDRERCLAVGMNDYVSKPVEEEDLKAALERWKPAKQTVVAPAPVAPAAVPSTSPPADVRSAQSAPSQPSPAPSHDAPLLPGQDECPVNVKRLERIVLGDPEKLRQMVDLFLAQGDPIVKDLGVAIRTGAVRDVEQLAHKLGGASSSFGAVALVPALRELERQGRAGELVGADDLYQQTCRQYERVREFLARYVEST
jgi:PAS domain S-box-containing protein